MRFTKMVRMMGLAASLALFSLTASGATIKGTVKGPDGAPFKGAFIQAQNTKTKIMVSVLSDKDGHYSVEPLPEGTYDLRIKAVGFRADPIRGTALTADQNASFDFALQKGAVHWNDISLSQARTLMPDGRGKDTLLGDCTQCHNFQSRMASAHRDEDGWKDRVNYMVDLNHFIFHDISDQKKADLISYLTAAFGPDANLLPSSPTDLPAYKGLIRTYGDDAMKVVYTDYTLPGASRMPFEASPNGDGKVWIPELGPYNGVAQLDPQTGEFHEFKVDNEKFGAIHSAVAAPDGTVWFAEQAKNRLGHLDPKSGETKFYQDMYVAGKEGTREGGQRNTVRIDSKGKIWVSGDPLVSFDPSTEKFTRFDDIPSSDGMVIDPQGSVWVAEMIKGGKIVKIDGQSGKATKYTPTADAENLYPLRIDVDSQGLVWFSDRKGTKIGSFDPKTSAFKDYDVPGPDPGTYAIVADKDGNIWYSADGLDEIGRLDAKTGHFTTYPFPYPELTMRELRLDGQGRVWWASPANNKVGYLSLTK